FRATAWLLSSARASSLAWSSFFSASRPLASSFNSFTSAQVTAAAGARLAPVIAKASAAANTARKMRWNRLPAFFMPVTSHLQKFPDGGEAASHADHNARQSEHRRHWRPELREGHHLDQLQRVVAVHTPGHCRIQRPLEEEGDHRAQQAQHEALIHKGPADEAVGGAHHPHDGDLLPPVKGGELDGVGDDEHRHYEQDGDQCHAYHRGYVPHSDKTAGDLLVVADIGDAGEGLHRLH
ncbi:AhpC/TSA family, partial [Dysosmobacter welbionis]